MKQLKDEMNKLVIGIEREIDAVEGEVGAIPDDFAIGLCHRFADDWNLYAESGGHPEWLRWVVVGVLAKKGITEL